MKKGKRKEKKEIFIRLHARVLPSQLRFVKKKAKSEEISEGEAVRQILSYYINSHS